MRISSQLTGRRTVNSFSTTRLIQRLGATCGYCLCPETESNFHICKLNSMKGRGSSHPTGTGLLIPLMSRGNLRYMFSHSQELVAPTGSQPPPVCSHGGDTMAKSFFISPRTES